jgi:hypothetical protein
LIKVFSVLVYSFAFHFVYTMSDKLHITKGVLTMSINKENGNVKKCSKCDHEQHVNEKNIYQDIKGKFTVCEKCNNSYDVEIE